MAIRRRTFLELGAATAASALAGCVPPPEACLPRGPGGKAPSLDGKVEHFIVLMMENRSYDQMLGGIQGAERDGVPAGAMMPYERHGKRESLPVLLGQPQDRFYPDPSHDFEAVHHQIHGGGEGKPADMSGFAKRFAHDYPDLERADLEEYALVYADGRLPILQGLAKEYGVCSHWFGSLPSSTAPNRMFTHAGTSGGATHKGAYYSRIRGKMIFDLLGPREPRSFRVYFHDMPHLWLTGDAWTKTFGGHFFFMPAFRHDVERDQLATYTFIEPQHVMLPWSSQHPTGGVSYGEELIASVYNTLVSNPAVFAKSLLLIVYDEHGGFYDHVVPPGHAGWNDPYPGIHHEVVAPDDARGNGPGIEAGYDFTTLGPRVPAVVVSPWIDRGSVFGWKAADVTRRLTFDHTSILSTVGTMTGTWVESKRARAATPLSAVLNRATPRGDYLRRLAYDERAYRDCVRTQHAPKNGVPPCEGVAEELCTKFRETHSVEPTPEHLVEHMQRLLGD